MPGPVASKNNGLRAAPSRGADTRSQILGAAPPSRGGVYLPMQNVAKISPSKSSLVSSPVSSLKPSARYAGARQRARARRRDAGARRRARARALERVEVAAPRAERAGGLAGDAGRLLEVRDEQVDAGARQRRDVDDRRPLLASRCGATPARSILFATIVIEPPPACAAARRRECDRERLASVGDPEQPIGARDLEPRAAHAFALDGIVRCRAVPPCRRR